MRDERRSLKPEFGPEQDRLEQLHQQERVWFAWVCRLHDLQADTQVAHSAPILAIAQRRWIQARRILQRAAQEDAKARQYAFTARSTASAAKR